MKITLNQINADNLIKRIEQLHLGETITLMNTNQQPLAIIVGINRAPQQTLSPAEWQEQWESLAQRVGEAWQSEKSAVEILSEMRR